MEVKTDIREKNVIDEIKSEVKRSEDGRQEYKQQALQNVLFLYGRQYSEFYRHASGTELVDRIAAEIESSRNLKKIRRTSNYILPLFRSLYTRLTRQQANVQANPTTATEKDRNAAKISKEVAEDFWSNCNRHNPWMEDDMFGMQAVLMKLNLYQLTIGGGYLVPYFNPKAMTFVYNEQAKDAMESDVGEVEVRVEMPLNVYPDRFGRHIIVRRFISPEQVFYEYGVDKCEPQNEDDELVVSQIMRILEGTPQQEHKEGVYVYDKYCLPTNEYPKGRLVSVTDNKELRNQDLPEEYKMRKPLVGFKYQDFGFATHGQGAIEPAIDIQRDYNETLTRIAHYKRNLTGKVLVPRNANLSSKYDDNVGQIIYHALGYKPQFDPGAPIPAYFYKEIERIRRDMEDVMSAHDTSIGRVPTGVKSGVGIENLTELDTDQIAPELIMQERKLGYFMENVLDIIQARYQERRLLDISGEDMAYEVKSFIGSDLFGQKKVEVRLGSSLPTSKAERQSYILTMRKEGLISDDNAKKLLEFGDAEGVYKTLDETGAKSDILNIIEGNGIVIAEPWEDHTIYLKVINDFRKGPIYTKLDDQRRGAINDLAKQHEDYLLREQEAARSVKPNMPAPAQPQSVV
jgi:hypothetical protein